MSVLFEQLCALFQFVIGPRDASSIIVQHFYRKYQQLIQDLLDCINNRNM